MGLKHSFLKGAERLRLGKLKRLTRRWKLNAFSDLQDAREAQERARFIRPLPKVTGAEAIVRRGFP